MQFFKAPFSIETESFDAERFKGSPVKSYGPLAYYTMQELTRELQVLADVLKPNHWHWVEVKNSPLIRAHRDHDISAALNIYVRGGDAVTKFYEPLGEGYAFPGETNKNMFAWDQIREVSSFTAVSNDVYLLDVSQVHSVTQLVGNRFFIQANWSDGTSFKDLVPRLQAVTL